MHVWDKVHLLWGVGSIMALYNYVEGTASAGKPFQVGLHEQDSASQATDTSVQHSSLLAKQSDVGVVIQDWGDVYYFCGSDYYYCRCDFTWNAEGWAKAFILWSFVVTASLGLQKLVIHSGLHGLLPGKLLPALKVSLFEANMLSQYVFADALLFMHGITIASTPGEKLLSLSMHANTLQCTLKQHEQSISGCWCMPKS